jgi:hypothetical protein
MPDVIKIKLGVGGYKPPDALNAKLIRTTESGRVYHARK